MSPLACGFNVAQYINEKVTQEIQSRVEFDMKWCSENGFETEDRDTLTAKYTNEVMCSRMSPSAMLSRIVRNHARWCRVCSIALHEELVRIAKKKRLPFDSYPYSPRAVRVATADGVEWDIQRFKCDQCGCDTVAEPYYHRNPRVICAPCRIENRIKLNKKTVEKRKVSHAPRQCAHCQEAFTPKRTTATFCSTKCRVANHRAT